MQPVDIYPPWYKLSLTFLQKLLYFVLQHNERLDDEHESGEDTPCFPHIHWVKIVNWNIVIYVNCLKQKHSIVFSY